MNRTLTIAPQEKGEPGSFTMMAALSLLFFMSFAALSIDYGFLVCSRAQLESAADAVALAASLDLDGTPEGLDKARSTAVQLMQLNDPNDNFAFDAERDVSFGFWNATTQTFDPEAPVTFINAVVVTAGRTRERGNALPTFFARLMGVEQMQTSMRAVSFKEASYGDPNDEKGVPGGHFDVDSYSHPLNQPPPRKNLCVGSGCDTTMRADGHVHEYDDRFDTRTYNAMSPKDSLSFDSPGILHSIKTDTTAKGSFKIVVVNAALSPGLEIVINGTTYKIKDYAAIPYASLPSWTSSTLTELKIMVGTEAIRDGYGLHRTIYDCAWSNMKGANGEWRNGALTVQAISTTGTLDTAVPTAGGQGVAKTGLFHEFFLYWHGPNIDGARSSCYGAPKWEEEWDKLNNQKSLLLDPSVLL